MKHADKSKKRDLPPGRKAPKIQVIARAADILRALENQEDGLSLGEIALRVGLPRSTVQRIVTALADEQFLIAASPKSRVKLGPALIRLARATKVEVSPLVRPHIEALCRELGETVDLSVLQRRTAVFIDQVPGSHRLRAVSAIGERFPLHASACGKAMLAALPESKADALIDATLEPFTENTITDAAQLRREIRQAREARYALDMEEHTEGICAIGAWFQGPAGKTWAVSIPAPTARFSRNQEQFRDALLKCRDRIAELFGDSNTE